MDRLIGIIRESGALTARLARPLIAPDFSSREAAARAAETGNWHKIVECPLAALEPGLFPSKAQLAAAWVALGRVSGPPSADTLTDLRLVLAETVLGRPAPDAHPALPVLVQERRVRPTAAHPRAYQGTKHKPPKEKGVVPVDLRPALCGTLRLDLLSEAEAAQWAAEARLPEPFRTSLYPLVRRRAPAEVSEALALYWALGLDQDPARLAAAVCLFSPQCGPNTAAWCRFAAALPREMWTPLLSLLAASGAHAVPVQDLPPSFAEHLAEALTGTDPLYRAYWLLHGLMSGIAPEYLMAGYRLADAHGQPHTFHAVRRSGYFPAPMIRRWGAHCRACQKFYSGLLLTLWEQCGLRPGLGECLEKTDWTGFAPDVAYRCLRLFAASWDNWGDLPEEQAEAKWQAARRHLGALGATLRGIPEEFQEKCVWHLIEYLWQWDTPAELQANLPAAFALIPRLCRPPFAKRSDPCEVTTDFLAELSSPLRERFLNAPDASFRRLEEACRRANDTGLIGRGTYTLTRTLPDFSVRCFEAYPALLFKVAKLLGCLPAPVRESVTSPFRTSPFFAQDLAALPPEDAAALVEAHRDPEVFHPVPPKLREHLAGARTLAPVSLERASAQMGAQMLRARLEMLERAALKTLREGYPVEAEPGLVTHALQMERLADDNRRPLRKFLRAYWDGQARYIEDHPQTRRWLDAHPRLDRRVWLQGVRHEQEVNGVGQVTLATESDPLEVLKMGTYVGSCLGLGGAFTHSAAAVALDINKQVVYARDARGSVLARQLVAVAEDDRLVCFSVYPLGVEPALESLFAEYDRHLSSALGLPLYAAGNDEDYEIARILSHAWWDDWAWDLTVDQAVDDVPGLVQ